MLGVGNIVKELSAFWRVREDEDALTPVRRTDVGSSNARPVRVIPERGQVAEYAAEPAAAERRDVLQDDELWS